MSDHPRHAVISGASIAGLSTAFWLKRTGWDVTVIERAPRFRHGGQNVDLRGVARDVLRRMGLFDAVKAHNTTEEGTVLLKPDGKILTELPSEGPDGATAELEILRGDLAEVLRDALPRDLNIIYDDVITDTDQKAGGVSIRTKAGRSLDADLLIVAEGVRSSTRDMVFGNAVGKNDLGITFVFGTIPRQEDDDRYWRWCNIAEGRQIHLRPDNHGTIRAMLGYYPGEDITGMEDGDALAAVRERFDDAGWEATRVLDGFDTSDDVYVDRLCQIEMDHWHKGRVVLVGDAGWCVTPLGGGGASLALTGGYVLAAYLATHPNDHDAALKSYEDWMRPLVEDVQGLPPGLKPMAFPQSRAALVLRGAVLQLLTSAPFKPLAKKLSDVAETERDLPEMPG